MYNYNDLEQKLNNVLQLLKSSLPRKVVIDISDYISVGEYGLAYDLLLYCVEDVPIPHNSFQLIAELARMMEYDPSVLKKLNPLISEG